MSMSENMRGALFMTGAMVAFTVNDACIKAMDADLPLMQILALRSVGVIVFLGILAFRVPTFRIPAARRDRWLILLRSAAEAGTAWMFLTALRQMQLANATAILQLLPLTVTLAGALVFREPLGWKRLSAIGVGFVGMLLVVRPGAEGFNAYTLLALGAVMGVTIRDLAARRLSPECSSLAVSLAAAIGVLAMALLGSAALDWQPLDARGTALLGGSTLFVIGGYVCSVAAMRAGEIGFVAPFRYTGLVAALVLGLVVFGEWPQAATLLGAALIVGTGAFTFYRERRLEARAIVTPPMR